MKMGWQRSLLLLLVFLAMWGGSVAAQGDKDKGKDKADAAAADPAPAAKLPEFKAQTSGKFGFTIALPAGGTLLTPDSTDWPWPKEPAAAYHWYGQAPAKEVIVHCYEFQMPVTEGTFKEFKTALEQSFVMVDQEQQKAREKDRAAAIKEMVGAQEKYTQNFKLGDETGQRNTTHMGKDGSRWNILVVNDMRKADSPVGYSILSTYGGNRIYTVTLLYLGAITPSIKEMGGVVMGSLSDPTVLGPFGIEPIELVIPETPSKPAKPARSAKPGRAGVDSHSAG